MKKSSNGARLIIVCGLPGSGKTTLAKRLEESLPAVRLAPDEWMDALSIGLYDEESRARIEALQWKFGQELLKLGLAVIIEWGTWGRSERDTLREGARMLGAAVELHYLSAPPEGPFRAHSAPRHGESADKTGGYPAMGRECRSSNEGRDGAVRYSESMRK
jgi:predicted kinase